MIYNLHYKALGHTNLQFDLVDGDLGKVENEDRSIDIGINPPSATEAMEFGRRVRTDFLPTKIRPTTAQSRMPDFGRAHSGHICSARFRDVVEALEPGVHQFVPVEVVRKNNDHVAGMFWFVCCNRLDTLEISLVRPPLNELGLYSGLSNDRRIVFNRSQVGGHHIWIDKRAIGGYLWATDVFHKAGLDAWLAGLNMIPVEAV